VIIDTPAAISMIISDAFCRCHAARRFEAMITPSLSVLRFSRFALSPFAFHARYCALLGCFSAVISFRWFYFAVSRYYVAAIRHFLFSATPLQRRCFEIFRHTPSLPLR